MSSHLKVEDAQLIATDELLDVVRKLVTLRVLLLLQGTNLRGHLRRELLLLLSSLVVARCAFRLGARDGQRRTPPGHRPTPTGRIHRCHARATPSGLLLEGSSLLGALVVCVARRLEGLAGGVLVVDGATLELEGAQHLQLGAVPIKEQVRVPDTSRTVQVSTIEMRGVRSARRTRMRVRGVQARDADRVHGNHDARIAHHEDVVGRLAIHVKVGEQEARLFRIVERLAPDRRSDAGPSEPRRAGRRLARASRAGSLQRRKDGR